jgi:DNA polymerase-3 subunit delta
MAAVTLVVGDEELLVARAVHGAGATGADEGDGGEGVDGVGSTRYDVMASELDTDALAEMTSPSLFAEDRVVVIRGLQDAGKDIVAALVTCIEARDDGVTLVITHAGGAKGKAALDAVKGTGATVVPVEKVKSVRDREQFVQAEIKAAGGTLDREAAADLVAAIGTDLRELAIAAEQLVADVGRQVSGSDVATYHRGRAESTGFAVADRAVEGDLVAALETLRWAFATGVDPILVSSSLAANLRTIAIVAAAGRGSPDSLAGPLGMPPWKIRRAQGWVKRWRPEAVATAVRAVAIADADLKGAGDDAAYAVERAVLAVAAAAGGN